MFKRLFLLIVVLCSCSKSTNYPHRLAICAIFKNEAPYLKEWVDYHHDVLRVNYFYLYNNDSSDNYREVLQPYIDQEIVELIDWTSNDPTHQAVGEFMDAPWSGSQLGAYNDCLKKALGIAKWVAMIDIDEFIVPGKSVKRFYKLLDDAERNKAGTVCLHWRVFGTSDVEELLPGEKLTEKLTWRSRDDHPWNGRVKSIHRPEAVAFCLIHIAKTLKPNFRSKTFKPDEMCLHHYWTRTTRECLEKRSFSYEMDPTFFDLLHQIDDPSITKIR